MASSKRWDRIKKYRKSYDIEADVKVCDGFPIVAMACAEPADPSVGIFNSSFCDVQILTQDFLPATFIERKLSPRDWEEINYSLRSAM